MTAAATAGAASHDLVDWHTIDWHKAHQNVRRLQARIVKATQEGRWGKVKALQHLLTHSYSGKVLAVKRVRGLIQRAPKTCSERMCASCTPSLRSSSRWSDQWRETDTAPSFPRSPRLAPLLAPP